MPRKGRRPSLDPDDFFDDATVLQKHHDRAFDSQKPRKSLVKRLSAGSAEAGSFLCYSLLGCCRRRSPDSDWDSDEEEDEDDMEQTDSGSPSRRRTSSRYKLSLHELRTMRDYVRDELGIPDDEDEWSPWLKLQGWMGILWLRQARRVRVLRAKREKPPCQGAKELMALKQFETVIAILILLNCFLIGVEGMYKAGDTKPVLLDLGEHLFVLIFFLEWTLRILGGTWVWCISSRMNFFDTSIVWLGVVVSWFLTPLGINAMTLRRFGALRILRLARIIRVFRLVPALREMWVLVDGVINCFYLLFWAFIIIFVVQFMFAVSVIETVVRTETFASDDFVEEHFGGLFPAMFTLFQIMTFDNWAKIVRPIVFKMPSALPLFVLYVGVTGLILLNLMTAVVVRNALVELPKKDQEAQAIRKVEEKRKKVKNLRKMFDDIDSDKTGRLSKEEFDDVLEDVSFARMLKLLDIDLEELPDIFDILDDGDGEISLESFISGLMRMQGPALSRDVLKSSKRMQITATGVEKEMEKMKLRGVDVLHQAEGDLDLMHEDFAKMQVLIKVNIEQLNNIGMRRIMRGTSAELPLVKTPTLDDAYVMGRKAALGLHERAARGGSGGRGGSPVAASDGGQPRGQGHGGGFMKPLPAPWIVRRKQAELERRRQQALEGREQKKPAIQIEVDQSQEELPGVHRQFERLWRECGLAVPDVSGRTLEQVAFGGMGLSLSAAATPAAGGALLGPATPKQMGPPLVERPPAEPWPTFVQGISPLLLQPAPPGRLPPIAELGPPAPDSLPAMLADLDIRELPHHPHTPSDGLP